MVMFLEAEQLHEIAEIDGYPVDDNQRCPFCGAHSEDDQWGIIDVYADNSAGDQWLQWRPCCMGSQDWIERFGFEDWYGISITRALEYLGIPGVRETYIDGTGVIRFRLEGRAPGKGVKGWQTEVFREVDHHHLHHQAPVGWKFGVEVRNGLVRVGVAVVGRPVSRQIQSREPGTLEVTRVCTWGDPRLRRNAASKLYGLCRQEAKKIGATKLITYTLETEDGASLRAANFTPVAKTQGGSWNCESRPRIDKAPTCPKVRWEAKLK